MVSEVAEVERALLALSPDERVAVIERDLLSLDDVDDVEQDDLDAAWLAEIDRRVGEYASGDAKVVGLDAHVVAHGPAGHLCVGRARQRQLLLGAVERHLRIVQPHRRPPPQ